MNYTEISKYKEAAIKVYGIDPFSKNRKTMTVWGRYAIIQSLIQEGLGVLHAGNEISLSHCTVIHSRKKHESLYGNDKYYRNLYDEYSLLVDRKKCYIAGKITGLSKKEYTKMFDDAEQKVLSLNMYPINPTKLKHEHDKSWESYMRECVAALMGCSFIYALPNYKESKGAIIEIQLAIDLKIPVIYGS